jgi:glucose/arabinose dehydrogenase
MRVLILLLLASQTFVANAEQQTVHLRSGKEVHLRVPEGWEISVALEGLKRVRFFAEAPDGRLFVTDMYNRSDNQRGTVYILEGFDRTTGKIARTLPYLQHLRNPNSIAFYTDSAGQPWFYLALTDRLVRYRYHAGETAPSSEPQVLATFPDYGLDYKYGGWHLTRTIAFADNKLYVSVGSSCNACVEKEEVRATVLEMDPDGSRRRTFVHGLRNAVGLRWLPATKQLFATNMGADHLGNERPQDTFYALEPGKDYGWPYCYSFHAKIVPDPKFGDARRCTNVPRPSSAFLAHSSPLGFAYFDPENDAPLKDSFVVALHGSSRRSLNRGYRLVTVRPGEPPRDFLTGFLENGKVLGRPADVFCTGRNSFLFTDDYSGVIYFVRKR